MEEEKVYLTDLIDEFLANEISAAEVMVRLEIIKENYLTMYHNQNEDCYIEEDTKKKDVEFLNKIIDIFTETAIVNDELVEDE